MQYYGKSMKHLLYRFILLVFVFHVFENKNNAKSSKYLFFSLLISFYTQVVVRKSIRTFPCFLKYGLLFKKHKQKCPVCQGFLLCFFWEKNEKQYQTRILVPCYLKVEFKLMFRPKHRSKPNYVAN